MCNSVDFNIFRVVQPSPLLIFFFKKVYFYLFIYFAVPGLSCGVSDVVPWPENEPGPPVLGMWSLRHWTTREVPLLFTFTYSHHCKRNPIPSNQFLPTPPYHPHPPGSGNHYLLPACMDLIIPDISCKGNQTVCHLLYVTSFTPHHVFKVRPQPVSVLRYF